MAATKRSKNLRKGSDGLWKTSAVPGPHAELPPTRFTHIATDVSGVAPPPLRATTWIGQLPKYDIRSAAGTLNGLKANDWVVIASDERFRRLERSSVLAGASYISTRVHLSMTHVVVRLGHELSFANLDSVGLFARSSCKPRKLL